MGPLHLPDPHDGSLRYEGFHDEELLQGRYGVCLLLEYAATLGLVDVAYIAPAGVRRDFRSLWCTDDLGFLEPLRWTPLRSS